jgi:hypothetical protein
VVQKKIIKRYYYQSKTLCVKTKNDIIMIGEKIVKVADTLLTKTTTIFKDIVMSNSNLKSVIEQPIHNTGKLTQQHRFFVKGTQEQNNNNIIKDTTSVYYNTITHANKAKIYYEQNYSNMNKITPIDMPNVPLSSEKIGD